MLQPLFVSPSVPCRGLRQQPRRGRGTAGAAEGAAEGPGAVGGGPRCGLRVFGAGVSWTTDSWRP